MASLTIRNLTITPLELRKIERFEGDPVASTNKLENITSRVTSLFNASQPTTTPSGSAPGGVVPRDGAGPHDSQDISGVDIAPFAMRTTDLRAPDPGREVVRLTFGEPGTGWTYTVDAPAPSPRSSVMVRSDGAPHEFTCVYVPGGATVTIMSSANLASWMRELHSDLPLSALSLPGTHNSPTCYTALPSVRCQAVGVRAQLDNGVRFLDIRVSCDPESSDLALVHSAFPISLTGTKYFHDLLNEVYSFLDANPSETVLISIKREGTGRGNDGDLARHLSGEKYMGGDKAGRWFRESRVPSLGETRGKIVLVRRFGGTESADNWGVDGSSWPDNCADGLSGSGLCRIQDFYEVDQSTNIQKKIDLVRAHLERAGEPAFAFGQPQSGPSPFFVNFLSASNFFNASCWPEKIAAKVNPGVIEYLCMRHGESGKGPGNLGIGDAGTGIVVTDWVGANDDWDLIRCIVAWNAKLQMKQ